MIRHVQYLVIAALLAFGLAACGTTNHITGVVTDAYSGTVFSTSTIHHYFVVNGTIYQDDWDTVQKGDTVSFDYDSHGTISNFYDGK